MKTKTPEEEFLKSFRKGGKITMEDGLKRMAELFPGKKIYITPPKPEYLKGSIVDQWQFIQKLALRDDPVLIFGPSGSGKEGLARRIHSYSYRSKKKFLPINCGGINENLLLSELFGHVKGSFTGAVNDKKGAVEIAKDGTLFLDEIGDMPLTVQIALLRFLDGDGEYQQLGQLGKSKHANVRIICATNKDLQNEIKNGKFREDLFYRINVFLLCLESIAPVPDLMLDDQINYHWLRYAGQIGPLKVGNEAHRKPEISEAARKILKNYDYPGNYRELNNIVKYALARCDGKVIKKEDLPDYILRTRAIHKGKDLLDLPADKFKAAINEIIYRRLSMEVDQEGNVSKACRSFNMDNGKYKRRLEDARSGNIL